MAGFILFFQMFAWALDFGNGVYRIDLRILTLVVITELDIDGIETANFDWGLRLLVIYHNPALTHEFSTLIIYKFLLVR